jgi:hypothetical protein
MEYLMDCLSVNQEYIVNETEIQRKWIEEVKPYCEECLNIMRSYIPPDIFVLAKSDLLDYGLSNKLSKRIFDKKALWLCRLKPSRILAIHEAEFSTKFMVGSDLDIIEISAIYAILPDKFLLDKSGKKEKWKNNIIVLLKSLMKDKNAGKLYGNKLRHSVYKNEEPLFDHRKSLYDL